MFGIDAVELVLIIVLGVVMFGPERLPEYSRKAARVFVYLRDVANNAKTTLRSELGPDYANLELRDLHPKTFIAKHLREEVAAIDEARREMEQARQTVTESVHAAERQAGSAIDATRDVAALPARVPDSRFDPEAT